MGNAVDRFGVMLVESKRAAGTGWSFVPIKIIFELLKQLSKAARLWGIAQDMSHVGPFSCSN